MENIKLYQAIGLTTVCTVSQTCIATVQLDCLADNLNVIFKFAQAAGHMAR